MNKILILLAAIVFLVMSNSVYAENCTNDTDLDGICNNADNCISIKNPGQNDTDNDGVGDTCDNCPRVFNPGQNDTDNDGVGDTCDNCPIVFNPDQKNSDNDSYGDDCGPCIDLDNDIICDNVDNCVGVENFNQEDSDGDGIGDACENLNNSNQSVSDSDISNLRVRLSSIKPNTTEEKNMKNIAVKFFSNYTSKEAYGLILNVADLLSTCVYFDEEWGNENRDNVKIAAGNIDKIYLSILSSDVQNLGTAGKKILGEVKAQSDATYLEKISFVKIETKNLRSEIRNEEKDKTEKEYKKKTLLETKETLLSDITILEQEFDDKNKQKEEKTALLTIEKEKRNKVNDEYTNLKNSVAGSCSVNVYLGIFLGLLTGVLVTYIMKKESEYWSTYTSADLLNPSVKAALVITAILIIIFAALMFTGIPVTYCIGG